MRRLTPMWSRLHSSAIPMFIRKPLMAGNLFGHYGMVEAARKIDIIDARPAFTQADADALNARFEGVGTGEMLRQLFAERSEARRVGKECVRKGRSRCVLFH